ncbi:MAG: RAMP superfamily CRISPR-associated protein, partial [Bacteroidota bacterium]
MKIKAYILRALTHLHPGSGDSGYGAVDKMVQIDPVGELPTIFSSSLKGAFRELFVQAFPEDLKIENKKQTRMDHPLVEFMYGTGVKATREDSQKDEPRHPGAFRFHQAYLLSIPVRSNVKPFFSATSPDIIKDLLDKAELLNINLGDGTKKALSYLASQNIKEKQPKILTKDEGVWLEVFRNSIFQKVACVYRKV